MSGVPPQASLGDTMTLIPHQAEVIRRQRYLSLIGVLAMLMLVSCGGGNNGTGAPRAAAGANPAPLNIVVRIGDRAISGSVFKHWLAIGEATVEMPKATGSLPTPIEYAPPDFTACVERLRKDAPRSTPTAPLRAECRNTYEGIRNRILGFLITGYWLRGEAAQQHASVSKSEVRKKFDEERRTRYPSAASFRRLQDASGQTVPDLEFALGTRLLSARLLERFARRHGDARNEQAAIAAFDKSIKNKWEPRTTCAPGYVVPDCKEYSP